jgi:hypothetical protein
MTVLPDLRAQLVAAVQADHASTRSRRAGPRLGRTSVLAALAVLAGSGLATATVMLVVDHPREQSTQLTKGPPKYGDQGPAVTYGRPLATAARRIQRTVPYPDGVPDAFDWSTYHPDPGARAESEGSLRMFIEFRASCMWRRAWVNAALAHDTARQATARTVLIDIPHWAGIRGDRGSGPQRAQAVARWVRHGNVAAVSRTLVADCSAF